MHEDDFRMMKTRMKCSGRGAQIGSVIPSDKVALATEESRDPYTDNAVESKCTHTSLA